MKTIARGFPLVLLATLAVTAAHAGSLIGTYAPNGGVLTQKLTTGFANPGDPASAVVISNSYTLPGIEPFNPGAPVFTLSNGQTTGPAGESAPPPKPNEATLNAVSTYSLGGVATQDSLTLNADGTLSALTALTRPAGDPLALPADAFVTYIGTFQFFVDDDRSRPGAPAHDAAVGTLRLPDLRALDPAFETLLSLGVFVDGGPAPAALLSAVAGGITAGVDFTVLAGHFYSIQLDYNALVAAGTDPPFTLGVIVDLTVPDLAVPEPATLSLLGIAFAGLGIARRRAPR